MAEGPELAPYHRRPSWRLIRRLGRIFDPVSTGALDGLDWSLRVRIPRGAAVERRLGAEAIDSFLESSASFPALVRGLATGNEMNRALQ